MSRPPACILLGEDNPEDVYLIQLAIAEHGIASDLHVARHGAEMLQALKVRLETSAMPDLILLDLNLPRHDGLEILAFIRQRDDFAEVPVVILTSSDSPNDTRAAARLGANEYIRKPSSLDDFLAIGATLRSLLERAGQKSLTASPQER